MHDAAHNEAADGAAGEVQRGTVLHAQMPRETALGKEVSRQLDRATETGPDHSGADTPVEASKTLTPVNL